MKTKTLKPLATQAEESSCWKWCEMWPRRFATYLWVSLRRNPQETYYLSLAIPTAHLVGGPEGTVVLRALLDPVAG